jgi:hypothetical protein
VDTKIGGSDVAAQAFVTPTGKKLLLANKRNKAVDVALPDADKATAQTVDLETGDGPARNVKTTGGSVRLEPFAVTVVSW